MDHLNQILARILNRNSTLKQGVEEAKIIELWPSSVGPAIAKHTRAIKLKNKTLLIEVDHPIWKQELHSNKMLALKQLNLKIKTELEINFEVDDFFLISAQPKRNEHQNKG